MESLRSDALQVAVDMGQDELMQEDGSGIRMLMQKIRDYVFPLPEEEAKSL